MTFLAGAEIDEIRDALLELSEAAKGDERAAELLDEILVAAVLSNARASDRTPRAVLDAHFAEAPSDDVWRTTALPAMDQIAVALGEESTACQHRSR